MPQLDVLSKVYCRYRMYLDGFNVSKQKHIQSRQGSDDVGQGCRSFLTCGACFARIPSALASNRILLLTGEHAGDDEPNNTPLPP